MNSKPFDEKIETWLDLSKNGRTADADRFYYKELFGKVIEKFSSRYPTRATGGILVSLLGFSPEPVILTATLLKPQIHIILTTPIKPEVSQIIEYYLPSGYQLVILEEPTFQNIYKRLKEALNDYPTSNITMDITGGKKSMVAAASIFGKDYGSEIVYVDFEEYIKDLRKPKPGTEYLNIVYNPNTDQPELLI